MRFEIFVLVMGLMFLNLVSSAHYIVGYVENAGDGNSPNGRTVELKNSNDEVLTDIVGVDGNSGANNIYMIDCEMFPTPCNVGDILNVSLLSDGTGYFAKVNRSVVVTGAGFDLVENISINSPPNITINFFDDELDIFLNEIDLTPGNTRKVYCSGSVLDYEGSNSVTGIWAEIFHKSESFSGDIDNKNFHYSNSSCLVDEDYGNEFELGFNCSFELEYYAVAGDWECKVFAEDNYTAVGNSSKGAHVNALLSIEVLSPVQFVGFGAGTLTQEEEIVIRNYGNVFVNLSLSGYGGSIGDDNAMVCIGSGGNISIENMKYNLSEANTGELEIEEANSLYQNLSSIPVENPFNLPYRLDGFLDLEIKSTFWRVYVPLGIDGTCSGRLVFGAVNSGI